MTGQPDDPFGTQPATPPPAAAPPDDPLAAGDAGRRVIRGGGLRAGAHVVGVAGGLLSAPLVVRHLGLEDFGRFAAVTAVITITTAIVEGGLTNVAVRRLATRDPSQQRAVIANLIGLRIVLALMGAAGALAFGLLTGRDAVVVLGLALGGVALLGNSLWGVGTTVLTARLRLGSVALVDIVRAGVTTVLLVALVVAGADLGPFYAVAPVAAAVALATTVVLLRRTTPMRPRADGSVWRSLLRETAAYAAATTLGAVYFQVALVTTSVLASPRETGVYSVGFRIVEIANGVPWLLAASVFPVLARAAAGDRERLAYAVTRTSEACLALGGLVAVGVVVGAPVATDIVGGDEARDAVPVLRVLGVAAFATYLVAAWSFVLLSLERYRDLILVNAAALVTALALSVVLVPLVGALGAATVTLAVEGGLATAYAVAIHRHRPDLGPRAGNWAAVVTAAVAGLGAGAALLPIGALPAALAAVGVYAAVIARLGGVPSEVLAAVRRR